MANDLGINVYEKVGIKDMFGQQSQEEFEFNAVGLLKVDVITGEIKIVVKQFIDKDKPGNITTAKRGQSLNINFQMEVK